ncbi:MAG: hypothetical protein ACPH09_09890, partial [Pseudomonadales bacterium]
MLSWLLPFHFGIQPKAMRRTQEEMMEERINALIAEYSSQGIHRTGTEIDHQSADWLIEKIAALGVRVSDTAFGFKRVEPLLCSLG